MQKQVLQEDSHSPNCVVKCDIHDHAMKTEDEKQYVKVQKEIENFREKKYQITTNYQQRSSTNSIHRQVEAKTLDTASIWKKIKSNQTFEKGKSV